MRLSIYNTHHSLSQVWRTSEEGNYWDKKSTAIREISYCFGANSLSKDVAGFSPLWFPQVKIFVSLVSCDVLMFYCYACYSLSKDPNIMLA